MEGCSRLGNDPALGVEFISSSVVLIGCCRALNFHASSRNFDPFRQDFNRGLDGSVSAVTRQTLNPNSLNQKPDTACLQQ